MFEAQAQCDLLHPKRENQTVLDELKFNIGSEAFEAQYQQQPVPPDGKMVKRNWFAYYDRLPDITAEKCIYQSWDTASKIDPQNNWSIGKTWLFKDGFYDLLDVCREKLTYTALRAKVTEKAIEYDPSVILIEDAGVGTGLIEVLWHEGLNEVKIQPTQSKEIRAHIQTPVSQSSRVLFPRSAPWLSELKAEILTFPTGRNDDQVDSITKALAYEYLTI